LIGDSGSIVRGPVGSTRRVVVQADIIADIPVAPFACVLSILYILVVGWQIFPTMPPGFQKELLPPREVAGEIRVNIDRSTKIVIDGTPAVGESVYTVMQSVVTRHRWKRLPLHVVILADFDATWGSAISVLDAGRQAGDDDIDLRMPRAARGSTVRTALRNKLHHAPIHS
jgi:biopolymer transport protein ExbD